MMFMMPTPPTASVTVASQQQHHRQTIGDLLPPPAVDCNQGIGCVHRVPVGAVPVMTSLMSFTANGMSFYLQKENSSCFTCRYR